MATFQESLQQPASKKLVFVDFNFLKHFFGWEKVSLFSAWKQSSEEEVVSFKENDVEANSEATFLDLVGADTTTVGAWTYIDGLLYVKPKDGTEVYENLYVGVLAFRYDKQGSALDGSKYDARVVTVPSLNLKTSEIFSNKLAQKGAGGVRLDDADAFFSRTDIEPDGIAVINSQLET